ncbi:hypothetical protein D3C80_629870 [compost metagenome]
MANRRGDRCDHLAPGRAGANHAHTLALQCSILWPVGGVVHVSLELVQAFDLRNISGRQQAQRGDQVFGTVMMAVVSSDQPSIAVLIEHRLGDTCFQLDIAAQIVAIHYMIEIGQNLRLGQIARAEVPLLAQLAIPGKAINERLTVGQRTGIAIPEPSATDTASLVERAHFQTQFIAQFLEHVDTAETCANHDRVVVNNVGANGTFSQNCTCHYVLLFRSERLQRSRHEGPNLQAISPRLPEPSLKKVHPYCVIGDPRRAAGSARARSRRPRQWPGR